MKARRLGCRARVREIEPPSATTSTSGVAGWTRRGRAARWAAVTRALPRTEAHHAATAKNPIPRRKPVPHRAHGQAKHRETAIAPTRALQPRLTTTGRSWRTTAGVASAPPRSPAWSAASSVAASSDAGGGRGARGARHPDAGSGSPTRALLLTRLERVPGSVPLRRGFRRGSARFRRTPADHAAPKRLHPRPPPIALAEFGPWVTCAALSRRSRGRARAPPPHRARAHILPRALRAHEHRHAPVRPERRARTRTAPGPRRARDAVGHETDRRAPVRGEGCRGGGRRAHADVPRSPNSWAPPTHAHEPVRRRAARGGGGARRVRARHAPPVRHLARFSATPSRRGGTGGWRTSAGRPKPRTAFAETRSLRALEFDSPNQHARAGRQARAVRGRVRGHHVDGEEAPNDVFRPKGDEECRPRFAPNATRFAGRRRRRRSPSFGPRRARTSRSRLPRASDRVARAHERPTPRSPPRRPLTENRGSGLGGDAVDFSLKKTRARSLARRRARKRSAATMNGFSPRFSARPDRDPFVFANQKKKRVETEGSAVRASRNPVRVVADHVPRGT